MVSREAAAGKLSKPRRIKNGRRRDEISRRPLGIVEHVSHSAGRYVKFPSVAMIGVDAMTGEGIRSETCAEGGGRFPRQARRNRILPQRINWHRPAHKKTATEVSGRQDSGFVLTPNAVAVYSSIASPLCGAGEDFSKNSGTVPAPPFNAFALGSAGLCHTTRRESAGPGFC